MAKKTIRFRRFVPLATILLLMAAAYAFGVGDYLTFENLKTHRQHLLEFVGEYPVLAPATYMAVYAVSVAISIPGAVFITLVGGFLFPQPWATMYVVASATVGAVAVFLAAQTALGDWLRSKAGSVIQRMRGGFQENAASYLLFLRLVPIFPFWLVNLAPAFFGVSLFTFAWTTFLGIIPGSFAFTQAGAGLGAILDKGERLSVDAVLNDQVKIALVALGLFALLPAMVKKIQGRRNLNP